ncbi:hypothetical protein BOTU111922_26075 [Bordetella tumulicola]
MRRYTGGADTAGRLKINGIAITAQRARATHAGHKATGVTAGAAAAGNRLQQHALCVRPLGADPAIMRHVGATCGTARQTLAPIPREQAPVAAAAAAAARQRLGNNAPRRLTRRADRAPIVHLGGPGVASCPPHSAMTGSATPCPTGTGVAAHALHDNAMRIVALSRDRRAAIDANLHVAGAAAITPVATVNRREVCASLAVLAVAALSYRQDAGRTISLRRKRAPAHGDVDGVAVKIVRRCRTPIATIASGTLIQSIAEIAALATVATDQRHINRRGIIARRRHCRGPRG